MKIDNKKINDIIIEIMESDEELSEKTSKLINIKNEVKNGITDFCRRANPIELGHKLNIPSDEVAEYLELVQKNWEIKELMTMLIDINKPFKEDVEKLLLKYIGKTHQDIEHNY